MIGASGAPMNVAIPVTGPYKKNYFCDEQCLRPSGLSELHSKDTFNDLFSLAALQIRRFLYFPPQQKNKYTKIKLATVFLLAYCHFEQKLETVNFFFFHF